MDILKVACTLCFCLKVLMWLLSKLVGSCHLCVGAFQCFCFCTACKHFEESNPDERSYTVVNVKYLQRTAQHLGSPTLIIFQN